MAHEPNPFESEIFQHYRIQEKAKTINNAIKILIEHLKEWLNHLQEELMDAILYIQKTKDTL